MKAFITHTTENYENIIVNLVDSINEFSNIPIYVYTINYDASDKIKSPTIRIDIDTHTIKMNKDDENEKIKFITWVASSKIDCMLDASKRFEEWVYIDGDSIVNYDIDNIFKYCKNAKNYPIATKGPHEYIINYKQNISRGNPFIDGGFDISKCLEFPLIEYLGYNINKRTPYYKTTNILIGNNSQNNKDFLNELKDKKNLLLNDINDFYYFLPYYEETLYNVMVWEKGDLDKIPFLYLNIINSDSVYNYFNNLKDNNEYNGNSIPDKVFCFHGVKNNIEYDKIISIIKNNIKIEKIKINSSREEVIPNLLNSLDLKIGVEIGVFKGKFSKIILNKWNGKLYLIDSWKLLNKDEYNDISNNSNYSDTIKNIKGFENRSFMIRGLSEEIVDMFSDNSLDFIYIDANHKYESIKNDMNLWWPKLKIGGLFSGHDYLDMNWKDEPFAPNGKDKYIWKPDFSEFIGEFGVNPAVDEFCKENNYKLNLTNEWFGTWFFIK
jgi:hypothetical protein